MAVGPWVLYNPFKGKLGQGAIQLNAHTFKLALYGSSSNAGTLTLDELADLTSELSGNGYARQTLTATWTEVSPGVWRFSFSEVTITASGGSIVARRAVIYDDTASGDPLVATALLDATPADVTVADGQDLKIGPGTNGIFEAS